MQKIKIYYTKAYNVRASHDMLKKCASIYTGIPESEFIVSGKQGEKPYFKSHPDVHFSISHSGKIWACAFAPIEVGFDVQVYDIKRDCIGIAERFFHPSEAENIKRCFDPLEPFTELWTRKEAVVKLFGIGIDSRMKIFDSRNSIVQFLDRSVYVKTIIFEDATFSALACEENFTVEIKEI